MPTELEVRRIRGVNKATRLINQAPLKLIPTAALQDELRVMTSSYGGGMLQGDQVTLKIDCHEGASLLLQAQGNQHLYRCDGVSMKASQMVMGKLEKGAHVLIVPEPTVMHQGASFYQAQIWDCHPDSNLMLMDCFHSGRSENGEAFLYRDFRSDIHLKVNDKEVYLDHFSSQPKLGNTTQVSRFGPYHLILNLYSYGKTALKIHQGLSEKFDSKERFQVSELPYVAKSSQSLGFCASSFDPESQIMTTRALFKTRHQCNEVVGELLSRSGDYFCGK